MSKRLTKEQFIKKSIVKHDDNYDYSLVEYINYSIVSIWESDYKKIIKSI